MQQITEQSNAINDEVSGVSERQNTTQKKGTEKEALKARYYQYSQSKRSIDGNGKNLIKL